MNYDSDEAVDHFLTTTQYLLAKNWKRSDITNGSMPGIGHSPKGRTLTTILHRNEQITYIQWANGTDFKNLSTIESCLSMRVGGVGALRPDWFLDSRPYFTGDIASQYLGNQHIYHRGVTRLVKQWRKSDFGNEYFVTSMQEHVGDDGIHWPLQINIPGEGNGPDLLRSLHNHKLIDDSDLDSFLIDQRYVAAGGSCPSMTPPPSEDSWLCSVCAKEYVPEEDGDGLAFEDLPDDWTCPRCGSPKTAYKKNQLTAKWSPADPPAPTPAHVPSALTKDVTFWRDIEYTFSPVWVPPTPAPRPAGAAYECNICKHTYDPVEDGNGMDFEDLPDDWKCPICGAAKSAYEKQELLQGSDDSIMLV